MNAFSFPHFKPRLTVLCVLTVACCGFLSGCTSQPVATSDLKIGDCFNMSEEVLTGTQPAGQVERVDCQHSHNSQVVGIKKLSGNSYPGEKQLYDLALKECAREFESFVGTSFRDSKWDLYPLSPTETTWQDEGERKLTCVALSLPEQKSSLKDSGK